MYSEDTNLKQICTICGNINFYKQDGYYFCSKCQTQNENIREEVLDVQFDTSLRLKKTKIRKSNTDKQGDIVGWTSWELYNFILLGITDELIKLGANADIKLTVIQLWATYLGKLEVAFISTKKKSIPKLAWRFHKKDAEIIYGKVQQQKKRKRKAGSGTSASSAVSSYQSEVNSKRELSKKKKLMINAEYDSFLFSQNSSEGETLSLMNQSLDSVQSSYSKSNGAAKIKLNKIARKEKQKIKYLSKKIPCSKRKKYQQNHVTTQYKMSPQVITPMKLWAIVYLALKIHDQRMNISDMLRFGREGHLSYYKLDHLLPPEVSLIKTDLNILSSNIELTHKGFRKVVADMAKFLDVRQLVKPDFGILAEQYSLELQLPRGVSLYARRLIALSQPKMFFDFKSPCIPNYEGRAMAFIIVVLKLLFCLDGITEYEIGRIAEQINRLAAKKNVLDSTLFNFLEWQRYIECRRNVLSMIHFPTKFKFCAGAPGSNHLFLRFFGHNQSKREGENPEIINYKNLIPQNLAEAFKQCIGRLNEDTYPLDEMIVFMPSLTPQHSYVQQLLEHPMHDLPNFLRINFVETKIGYLTKPQKLKDLAAQCSIQLDIVDSNLHFVEKLVPQFEQMRMPSVVEFKEHVKVENYDAKERIKKHSENLIDYLHRKEPANLKLNVEKYRFYNNIKHLEDKSLKKDDDDYSFHQILPNGKLLIPDNNDFESDEDDENEILEKMTDQNSLLCDEFCRKYNLYLTDWEKDSMNKSDVISISRRKPPKIRKLYRNKNGKFVKKSKAEDENDSKNWKESNNNKEAEFEEQKNNETNLSNNSFEGNDYQDTFKHNDKMFRPFKDYWMYHCIFSRVKPKNFELFEKELPVNFRWLLNECANVVEMVTEDLYEEVCLVESYFAYVCKSKVEDVEKKNKKGNSQSANYKNILQKW